MTEQTYTLEEARKILDRQECDRYGHHIDSEIITNTSGSASIHYIYCHRCGAKFEEIQ